MAQTVLFIDKENIHCSLVREYRLEPEPSRFLADLRTERSYFLCTPTEQSRLSRGENGERSILRLVPRNG